MEFLVKTNLAILVIPFPSLLADEGLHEITSGVLMLLDKARAALSCRGQALRSFRRIFS
jgi:hypothetical protein